MALSVKVGSITAPAGTGNQAYTGIGFQPKVVIFFGNGASADGMSGSNGSNSSMPLYLGFGVGSTYGVMLDDDDFTSGDPWENNTACIMQQYSNSNSPGTQLKASMVSLDADGFTLNWANTFSGKVVNYLALGGTELQASVVHPTVLTTTGSWAITGAGFQPDAAIILVGSNAYSASASVAGFGFVSKQGTTVKQGTGTTSYDGGSGVYQRTDQTIALVDGATKVYEASHTSMDTDGMTLNVTTKNYGGALQASVLFLKGVQIRSDAFAQKTSTGTQAYTGYGFTPKALLFGGMHKTAGTTVVSDGVPWMFGATDGTNRGVVAKISNSNGVQALDRTKCYKWPSDSSSPTVVAAADLSTFDSDGFTLNYTTADATARQTLVMAFGDPAGGVANTLTASPGSYAITGADVTPNIGRILSANPGSYIITGINAILGHDYPLTASPGVYTLTGAPVTTPLARVLSANPGAYVLTGADAALNVGRILAANPGSYVITGADTTLPLGHQLLANPGAYVLSGADTALQVARVMTADPGTYIISGADATLTLVSGGVAYTLVADPGTYTLTGAATALPVSKVLSASPGSYNIAGFAASLPLNRLLSANPGVYTITGADIATIRDLILNADPGAYQVLGRGATLQGPAVGGPSRPRVIVFKRFGIY